MQCLVLLTGLRLADSHGGSIHLKKEEHRDFGVEIDVLAHPDNGVGAHELGSLLQLAQRYEERVLEIDLTSEILSARHYRRAPFADLTASDGLVYLGRILLAKRMQMARELTAIGDLNVDLAEHIILLMEIDGGYDD